VTAWLTSSLVLDVNLWGLTFLIASPASDGGSALASDHEAEVVATSDARCAIKGLIVVNSCKVVVAASSSDEEQRRYDLSHFMLTRQKDLI
jgi:hypothetical protein